MFWDRLSVQPTWIVFFFQMSVGSDSDLNENDKDMYQKSVQENKIYICEEILKDVDNILDEFPDVPELNFTADTSHFYFYPNPINQSIFPVDKSVQPDLNPNPINKSIFPVDTSVQLDLNPNPINKSVFPADTSVQPDLNLNPINQSTFNN